MAYESSFTEAGKEHLFMTEQGETTAFQDPLEQIELRNLIWKTAQALAPELVKGSRKAVAELQRSQLVSIGRELEAKGFIHRNLLERLGIAPISEDKADTANAAKPKATPFERLIQLLKEIGPIPISAFDQQLLNAHVEGCGFKLNILYLREQDPFTCLRQ